MISPNVVAHFGRQGSGKTVALQKACRAALTERRFVAVDPKRKAEWPGHCTLPKYATAADAFGVASALRVGHGLVIVRPVDRSEDAMRKLADSLANECLEHSATLVLPEAWHFLPQQGNHVEGKYLGELVAEYRSAGAGLWMDSQFVASVSARARRACDVMRFFALQWEQDIAPLRELGGPQLVAAVLDVTRRFYAGQPGWFVETRGIGQGYQVRRA